MFGTVSSLKQPFELDENINRYLHESERGNWSNLIIFFFNLDQSQQYPLLINLTGFQLFDKYNLSLKSTVRLQIQ